MCGTTSTGVIVANLCRELNKEGHTTVAAYGRWARNCDDITTYRIGNDWDIRFHGIITRMFDRHGLGSKKATDAFIRWADEYNPDIVWMHNLHGYYLNYESLFCWLKKHPERKYYWTLHDCWSITGHCSHFSYVGCEKWRIKCDKCPQSKRYPACYGVANTENNYIRKKNAFQNVPNLTIITPSQWLANLVKQSYLKEYPVEVQYNKINTGVFKPTSSDFRKQYGIEDRIMVLAVANAWGSRKGIEDIWKLLTMLDEKYVVVIVGMWPKQILKFKKRINGILEEIDHNKSKEFIINKCNNENNNDRRQVAGIGIAIEPGVENLYEAITGECFRNSMGNKATVNKLICVSKTNNAKELAGIYTTADFFINPTYEDNYPTVNLEAIACGTYVITYDVGGCKETIRNENSV